MRYQVLGHELCSNGGTAVPQVRTPNHGGTLKATHLLVHYTAGASAESSIHWLCDTRAKASAHIVIAQDGVVTQLLPFNLVAWHAGHDSVWVEQDGTKREHFNFLSIGIELDNPGRLTLQPSGEWWSRSLGKRFPAEAGISLTHKHELVPSGWHVYPQVQLDAAFEVIYALVQTYNLKEILGHDDVCPGRKFDPGPAFPLGDFQARLLGRK
jgi:N-acetylmuramoyl-L-alanine amidase